MKSRAKIQTPMFLVNLYIDHVIQHLKQEERTQRNAHSTGKTRNIYCKT